MIPAEALTQLGGLQRCVVTGSVPVGGEVASWRNAVTRRGVARGIEGLRHLYDRTFVVEGDVDVDGDTVREIVEHVIELIAWGGEAGEVAGILTREQTKAAALLPLVVAMQLRAGDPVRAPAEVRLVAEDVLARVEARSAQVAADREAEGAGVMLAGPWLPLYGCTV